MRNACYQRITRMSFATPRYGLPKNFGNLVDMSDDLQRFARIVRARREELGLRQDQMRDAGGPSTTTMTKVENAADAPSRVTLRKLDAALRWEPGSAARALDGGEPTPLGESAGYASATGSADGTVDWARRRHVLPWRSEDGERGANALRLRAQHRADEIFLALQRDPRLTPTQRSTIEAELGEMFDQFYERFGEAVQTAFTTGLRVGADDTEESLVVKQAAATALGVSNPAVDEALERYRSGLATTADLNVLLFNPLRMGTANRMRWSAEIDDASMAGGGDDDLDYPLTDSDQVSTVYPASELPAAARRGPGPTRGEELREHLDRDAEAGDPEGPEGGA